MRLGRGRGLSDAEDCALSTSPRRSRLSFNGWCPAPGPRVGGIKAVCSPGLVSGVPTVKTMASWAPPQALPNQNLLQGIILNNHVR